MQLVARQRRLLIAVVSLGPAAAFLLSLALASVAVASVARTAIPAQGPLEPLAATFSGSSARALLPLPSPPLLPLPPRPPPSRARSAGMSLKPSAPPYPPPPPPCPPPSPSPPRPPSPSPSPPPLQPISPLPREAMRPPPAPPIISGTAIVAPPKPPPPPPILSGTAIVDLPSPSSTLPPLCPQEPLLPGIYECHGKIWYSSSTWKSEPNCRRTDPPHQHRAHSAADAWALKLDRPSAEKSSAGGDEQLAPSAGGGGGRALAEANSTLELEEGKQKGSSTGTRMFILYVPSGYRPSTPMALVAIGPDTDRSPHDDLLNEAYDVGENSNVLLAVLTGLESRFNVVKNAQAGPTNPDDVSYALASLRKIASMVCVDPRRVYCAGYSRGGRYCALLASRLSHVFAAIAPVASLRYPSPNGSNRPIPVIAFHGTGDPINPIGGGGPAYWHSSVRDAARDWAVFNGCRDGPDTLETEDHHTKQLVYSGCSDGAEVRLFVTEHMGHVWPGLRFEFARGCGWRELDLIASKHIYSFFRAHPLPLAFEPRAREALYAPHWLPGEVDGDD